MEIEEEEFILIVRGSIYAFMKEKYEDYDIDDNNQKEDVKKIRMMLSSIEAYAHIPDKQYIIEENYVKLKEYMLNADFRESKLLESMKKKIEGYSDEKKAYILNSIIYVMLDDLKISETEKEIIVQLSKILGIESDINTLMKNYNKTKFKRPVRKRFKALSSLLLLILVAGGALFYIKSANEVKLFSDEKIAFDEVYFNRFVIYKNKFDTGGEPFRKQAVFYLNGSAEIGINPKNLEYDFVSKTVTYTMPKEQDFLVEMKFNSPELIDEIKPKLITKEEAKVMGAVVGVAGAVVGAKVGSSLGSLIPSPFGKAIGAFAGGVGLGGATYYMTSKALAGASFKEKMSQTEKDLVIDNAKQLLKIVLSHDEELKKMYKKDFESYIISKYATYGYEVSTVTYKEGK